MGKTKLLDLRTEVYAAVGAGARGGTEIILTEMAMVDHNAVCPYRDV